MQHSNEYSYLADPAKFGGTCIARSLGSNVALAISEQKKRFYSGTSLGGKNSEKMITKGDIMNRGSVTWSLKRKDQSSMSEKFDHHRPQGTVLGKPDVAT